MGPFLKRYRELIVAALLLLLPLGTYAAHAQKSYVPGPIRQAIVRVTEPIQSALVWTVSTAQDFWYGYVDLRHVRDENLALRRQVLALSLKQQHVQEIEAENGRLRRMVSYTETVPDLSLLTAAVVAFGPDPRLRSVRIARGERDGVRAGMPVVTPDGLVGRISQVYANAADVQLIIDPSSAIPALSQRTRARATARGTGGSTSLRLDYVVKSDDIEEGDVMVTAPSGGLFPKGLKLGRVAHVTSDASTGHGLFKDAQIIPAVDFDRLEEVQVIMDNGPTAALDVPITSIVQ